MNKISIIEAPRHGYIRDLAQKCNCSRKTVARALFEGQTGPKSNLVLKTYHELYNSNNTEKSNDKNQTDT